MKLPSFMLLLFPHIHIRVPVLELLVSLTALPAQILGAQEYPRHFFPETPLACRSLSPVAALGSYASPPSVPMQGVQ